MKKALESVLEKNYPLNYRAMECKQIGEFIKLKESFSIIGMKDVGAKNIMRFIAYRNDVQKKYVGNPTEFEWIYLNVHELSSRSALSVFQALVYQFILILKKDTKIPSEWFAVQGLLRGLLSRFFQKHKKSIVMFFSYLEILPKSEQELLYANLYALRETQRYNVIYVFGNTRSTENDYFFCQKRIWVKPFDQAGALGVIKRNEDRFQIKLTPGVEQKYLELSGGHHGLIKYLIQTKGIIDMNILMQHVDIFHQCKRIAAELSAQEVGDLVKGFENNYLQKIGIQIISGRKLICFSPLFTKYLQSMQAQDQKERLIQVPFQEKLSAQEEALLNVLIEHRGSVVSREVIIEEIWNGTLPSDWAIDKLISRLREKINASPNINLKMQTIRNKGIVLK